jgi:hypothetical protein
MGSQPVHVHFFRPDYIPQFEAAQMSAKSEHIIISRGLVEESALEELGFPFRYTVTGEFALDGRLSTVSDICLQRPGHGVTSTARY